MHHAFYRPAANGVLIFGYDQMVNDPLYPWTTARKLVFPQMYKRWKKKFGEVDVEGPLKAKSLSMEELIKQGKYPAEWFIENVEYRRKNKDKFNLNVSEEEMALYRKLTGRDLIEKREL